MSVILEEYKRAKEKKRKPNCPYCHKPLEIKQTLYDDIRWTWSDKRGGFIKSVDNGDADKPYCVNCEMSAWDFVDFDLVNY